MSPMGARAESNVIMKCWQSLALKVAGFFKMLRKIGGDDPRRIVHSLKVGLALTLVSAVYYINPIFKGFGNSAMWAVLTVVLVMEFTVGAALTKGLNRTCGTLLAGALGVGVHHIATQFGAKGEPIVLVIFVFVIAMGATFARFIPELKARYDYGMMIFILTFCLVTVSSYRDEKVIVMAKERLTTIAIGVAISFFTTIFVFPIWAGEDLHRLQAANLEKLAEFLQGLGVEYFGDKCVESMKGKSFLQGYKNVLNSKAMEDTLAMFAKWEPRHGNFRFRHPWDQYLKVGAQGRRCAYLMVALDTYITKIEFKAKVESEFHKKLQEACKELSLECGNALTELAFAIRSMKLPAAANPHIAAASAAAEQLKKSFSDSCAAEEILHVAAIITLLLEIEGCTRQTLASVEELARLAHFKCSKPIVMPAADAEGASHVAIEVKE